ncbi:DUF2934 domain-containing protein [Beijerinckia sp. L45]|uniref:DUF2934 domain-containing protein n=1 Tax=Beijerinckia sp. L45 TaxID=1641855 RepID=UPI00131BC144|nr:DUF2934 domain-containing protein [Beijerinckia sp. L45]
MDDERTQRTRLQAYHLWEAAGRPDGRCLDFWLAAERHAIVTIAAAYGHGTAMTDEKIKHKDPALHASPRHDRELDEGLLETFPASDPLASTQPGEDRPD